MRLENKVAIITGAAAGVEGQLMGFGGAAARMFAQEGANVVLTDIKTEMGEATAAQIRENGGDAIFMEQDVTSEQRWLEVIAETVARYGKLDVLVNNAGTGARYTVEETSVGDWQGQMDIHGYCWTPLTDPGYSHEEGRRAWSLERIPLGRLGNADDIAHGIVYLASDESSFVTGAELVIDGGTTAQ